MSENRTCNQCKHRQSNPKAPDDVSISVCVRPDLPGRMDYVTGEPMYDYCVTQRVSGAGLCGPEGKFFEQLSPEDTDDELQAFRQKSIDWWTCRSNFSRYMFEEHKEKGYDGQKTAAAQNAYFQSRRQYQDKHGEEFNFDRRPAGVSEQCPAGVDQRVDV